MSGGERKKRISQGTGWEEAGGEFYQECYPGADLDLEALQRDPHYFATLLPSKQNRAATSRRPRIDNKSTFKRKTSTRSRNYNTTRQNTMPNDVHVAMMPDLSENLANEETTWEEIMQIKTMPINMAQKKEIKAKLLSADTFRLQGLKQFKWKRRKLLEYLRIRRKEFWKKMELWRKCFKKIEGNFGTGISAFFLFVKWLMFLNFTISLMIVCFLVLPTIFLSMDEPMACNSYNETVFDECCVQSYQNNLTNFTLNPYSFLLGDGWLERTVMFYGKYPSYDLEGYLTSYNLPIAYIAIALGYFLLSLGAIIKRASHGFKERLIEHEVQYYKYCTMIFSGWDYCIYNENSTRVRHQAVYNEIRNSLDSEKKEEDKTNRSHDENFRIFSMRLFVNSLILIIYFGCGSLVFFIFQFSMSELQKDINDDLYKIFLEFAPYLCIVSLNLVIPYILKYFIFLENYCPIFALRLTFFRTILLRFSLLSVLIASLYSLIKCTKGSENSCSVSSCTISICWETYFGQQIYKLLILDFFSNTIITFFLNFPRMLIAKHIKCKLAYVIGAQEFDIFKHVLDVVYIQTLIWLGSFYAPLLSTLATLLFFILFHIKKFACLVNSFPSKTIYGASRSDSMFMSVLLISFIMAVIPWVYAISELEPSKSCGPFRSRLTVWSEVQEAYQNFPWWVSYVVDNSSSTSVAIPTLITIVLIVYYYHTIAKANQHMVGVLKKQLVLEGHDKQFLLNRLSAFIKQHQDRHKAARSVDHPVNSN